MRALPEYDAGASTKAAGLVALFGRVSRNSTRAILPLNESALNKHNIGPAFYCVHSLGGATSDFLDLARLLDPEVRFFGIQAPTAKMQDPAFAGSIESIAECYAVSLSKFQPEGEFLVGGWSAGSIIALEMAQQLSARGRKVSVLVALDGSPSNTGAGISPWNPLYYWKLVCNLPRFIHEDLMKIGSLRLFTRRVLNKVLAFGKMARSGLSGEGIGGHVVEGFMDDSAHSAAQMSFMKVLYDALLRYVPQQYSGRVVVYEAESKPLYHLPQVEAVWRKIAPQLELVPAGGTHLSIIKEPHVIALAKDLRGRLMSFR